MFLMALAALAAADGLADPLATGASVHTLDNGLVVLLEPSTRTDTVALHITYGVGSRDEPEGLFGCAHLFEHLMFEGSKNVPTDMFDMWLTGAGGWNNAYTNTDVTAYHMAFPSGALDLALFLESDRLGFLDSGLDDANVANQQSVVLQERDQGYDRAHGRDWDAVMALLYSADHPYHHSVIGTVADVNAFETERVRSFWDSHYRTRNGVLALVGNFDQEEALERVSFWFSDVPDRGEVTPRSEEVEVVLGAQLGYLEDDVEAATVYLAWPTVPAGHADEAALDMLGYVLSYGRGTRIDDRLYYESSLATEAGAFGGSDDISGQVIIYATSPKVSLKKLEKVIVGEVERLIDEPPTEAELHRASNGWRTAQLSSLEDPVSRAEMLVECQRAAGTSNCLPDWYATRKAVTADDIVRVAQTYLTDERRVALSVVPRGRANKALGGEKVVLP
jgi:zinc protease